MPGGDATEASAGWCTLRTTSTIACTPDRGGSRSFGSGMSAANRRASEDAGVLRLPSITGVQFCIKTARSDTTVPP